jgi:branched-chain amino acid transport system ATP-binding protein
MGGGATLELDRLSAGYDGAPVVRGLSLTVGSGEVVALLGPNGAGKTTTLRAISGLVKPAGGVIRLDGADLAGVSPAARARLGIAHVPHDRGIFYGLTVAEHFRLDGTAAPEQFPRLHDLRDRRAGLLSGGEQQMLAISRALARKPRLLLLDELSLGLAPVIVGQLLDMVRRINEGGTAVVLVEQSVNIALSLVDHAYFMEKGEMRFDGPAQQLLARDDLLRAVFLEGASKAGVQE